MALHGAGTSEKFRVVSPPLLACLLLSCLIAPGVCAGWEHTQQPHRASSSHTNNWVVLIDTSKYWFNYRHVANTLSFYRMVKRLGIPDSNIILMLADDAACSPRNPYPARVFDDISHSLDIYGDTVEVDYRGYEVTVENVIRLLTGRHAPGVPRSQRLLSDASSNLLVYVTGHGGNEFIKLQDNEELMSRDIADAFQQMHEKGRYKELLFVAETCQAASLYSRIRAPGVLCAASSRKGENSYSHHYDPGLGLSVIDRFTYFTLEFFEKHVSANTTMQELFDSYTYDRLHSHFEVRTDLFERPLDRVRITDFFGSVPAVRAAPVYSMSEGL